MELWKKYRPQNLDELVGQPWMVLAIKKALAEGTLPHAILLTGGTGSGKTTTGRILAKELGCAEADLHEINAASNRGVDDIREVIRSLSLMPWGKARLWLVDEAHQLTSEAQSALLKVLEDVPAGRYFVLATTDPAKLKPTIRNRCTTFQMLPLGEKDMAALLLRVAKAEGQPVPDDEVVDRIIQAAEGSARAGIKLLESALQFDETDDQVAAVKLGDSQAEVIELCRALGRSATVKQCMAIVKGISAEPEDVRRAVLGYFRKVMLDNPSEKVYKILASFERNYHDSRHAGLLMSIWDACER